MMSLIQNAGNTAKLGQWIKSTNGLRALIAVLLLIIVVMFGLWQPWYPAPRASDRTITVTGSATITAMPDKYVFSPTYTFTNNDQQAALKALTAKSEEIVTALQKLGVAGSHIKTNASGYNNYGYYLPVYKGDNTYTLSLEVTVQDATLAQKVQDYLVTTAPSGSVTPQVSFSTAKQQQLQGEARDKAEQNARAQADQSAKNLGFSVGAVMSVVDGALGSPVPIMYDKSMGVATPEGSALSLTVQPGQNDLSYSVQVVYYIR